jgi:hypothetical protein
MVHRVSHHNLARPQGCAIFIFKIKFQCPLWVISGHLRRKTSCLLYPRKQTFVGAIRSVASFAAQPTLHPFLSGPRLCRRNPVRDLECIPSRLRQARRRRHSRTVCNSPNPAASPHRSQVLSFAIIGIGWIFFCEKFGNAP